MHVIYIHTHDSGRILGPYGYKVATPHLEELAKDATSFHQAYCVSPTCSPSRSAMLTSTYPHQNGMLGLAQRGFTLDYQKHLVPYLNTHGFHSVLCGIQHEAGWYLDHANGAKKLGYHEDITSDPASYTQEEMTTWDACNAKHIVDYLAHYRDTPPLFLSFGLYATHRRYPDVVEKNICIAQCKPPYPIPDNESTRLDFARYCTSAQAADASIGMVLAALKKNHMYENSIILFTTDHGLAYPFSKCTLFDDGIGVSLMMRTPSSTTKGKVVDELVSHIDVFPTLCDLLHLPKPFWIQGVSFAENFMNIHALCRNEIFAEVNFHTSYEPIRCIRTKQYKYIRYYDVNYQSMNLSNIDESLSKDYFMAHGLAERKKYQEALYDLTYDIGERQNLVEDVLYAKIKKQLAKQLTQHMRKTNDPLLYGDIPIQNSWKVNKKECLKASSKNEDDYVSLGK